MANDRYTKEAALALVNRLESYRQQVINGGATAAQSLLHSGWNDGKSEPFKDSCAEIVNNIKNAAKAIKEYSSHLDEKIRNF